MHYGYEGRAAPMAFAGCGELSLIFLMSGMLKNR